MKSFAADGGRGIANREWRIAASDRAARGGRETAAVGAGGNAECRTERSRRDSPFAIRDSRSRGFSLLELLVALAIFATMAALAYGGLDSVVRTRAELERRQAQFQALRRSVNLLERDLRQCAVRPVRGNDGAPLPAFAGGPDRIELTRLGFANPQAETRANLERVAYAVADDALERGVWPVLDRAPATSAKTTVLRRPVEGLRFRYLDAGNRWTDAWPPPGSSPDSPPPPLPRAVEFHIATADYGEISRIVELPSPWPDTAVESGAAP